MATQIINTIRRNPQIETTLNHEFHYTFHYTAQSNFIKNIHTTIINHNHSPHWQNYTNNNITTITAPLNKNTLI